MAAGQPLVRYLSRCHAATRQGARDLVLAGHVTVDGIVCRDGARRVEDGRHEVAVDGHAVLPPDPVRDVVVWAVNKPRGTVATTRDPEGRPTVMDLVPAPHAPGLAPIGRLDKASAGLLLVGNDSRLADRLLAPEAHVAKAYRVKVRGIPGDEALHGWRTTTRVVDGLALGPMEVEVESVGPKSAWLRIVLREGKNRQIRRRVAADGHEVQVLVRVAFGPIALGDLAPGAARRLDEREIAALREFVTP